ncbi:hypothetical protein FisN_1Hu418 [Fistulifera solaris]|uniref:Integrase catalytic domain-containing protein n=1 Tax=Fistulifera solaris TaxID=1519565 RepID=A0A1Z5JJN6_FISSO|nr:hypothetical protein FisN_1Hu418 [Fistulifera solaris]|eukprot:GAX14227.1 hypothetical protein FisN_1Hu418 [Fistulifera solaris]
MSTIDPNFPQFPNRALDVIPGRPTSYTLRILKRQVYANAGAIRSVRGGGAHGHLGVAMPDAEYFALTNQHFIPPPNPGLPPVPQQGDTNYVLTATRQAYDAAVAEFNTYTALIATLRAQILAAVEPIYREELLDPLHEYNLVSICDFLAFLDNQYGQMTALDYENNREQLSNQWDPSNPIEHLWAHIAKIKAIDPNITDATVILKTQDALAKSGVFHYHLQTWRDKPAAEQTWANFKDHFTRADSDRKHNLTTQAAGFHSAHMAATFANPIAAAAGKNPPSSGTPIPTAGLELFYCWSHGLNLTHNGDACKNPEPGHHADATAANRKGGSEKLRFGKSGKPSRSTGNYVSSNFPVLNIVPTNNPIHITIPDGSTLTSTHEGILDFPGLAPAARHVHIFPELHQCSLLSIGQLCDAGYHVRFDATTMAVHDSLDNIVLTGHRDRGTGLWHVPIPPIPVPHASMPTPGPPPQPMAARAIGAPATAELVAFAHASLFSPALSTLEAALLRGFLTNFPGLTLASLRKYPPRSLAMHKGHMDQIRKNLRSTKHLPGPPTDALLFPDDTELEDQQPQQLAARTNFCYISIIEPTGQIYTDQTGKFITPASLVTAYKKLHNRLVRGGLRPRLQRLDNEASHELKEFMTDEGIDYQLVPPAVHRRNAAERAIRTFANHFIAGLCSTDVNFPLHLWDQLIPQAEITLNLMRGSRINPNLSAFAQLNGTFDFNRHPLGPPGTFVLAHEKPSNRTTWSPHALEAWYVGPALESYRCYRVWIIDTRDTRICDTLEWFPQHVKIPASSSTDLIYSALQDILYALQNPSPASPLAPRTDSQTQALQDVVTLLTTICTDEDAALPNVTSIPAIAPLPRVVPKTVPDIAPLPRVEPRKVHFDPNIPSSDRTTTQLYRNSNSRRSPDRPVPPGANPTEPVMPTTYRELTGPVGRRNRRTQRRAQHKKATAGPHLMAGVPRRSGRTPKPKVPFAAPAVAATAPTTPSITLPLFAFHGTALNPDTGRVAEYRELSQCTTGPLWQKANCDEIGRLFQGLGPSSKMPTGTDTCHFIYHHEVPEGKTVTYVKVVCADRPEKADPERVRWTAGGDRIQYLGDVSTQTADVITVKVLINSVLSTPNAQAMSMDLKDFYLTANLDEYEYIRVPVYLIPDFIIDLYQLHDKIHNGFLYVEVRKGMYGLPQAGKLAHDRLQRQQAENLLQLLQQYYVVKTDWSASRYVGLTINWDYDNRTADISMPGYVERALSRFEHPTPAKPEHSPHAWTAPIYGSRQQYAQTFDDAPQVSPAVTTRIQEILGTLLYYARAVDCSLLPAIGTLATQQAHATEHTVEAITQLLNYCATHPDATVRFRASDMILHIESDASYLSETKARSRAAGYHYLSSTPSTSDTPPPFNGPIAVHSTILKEVVSSAAEAELAALFYNGKEACPIRTALEEMNHPQPATPIVTDNSTASGIANDTVKQKRSKAMDMRFYWIRDRVRQGQFHIYWQRGETNKADYFTKHHSRKYHQQMRPVYFVDPPERSNYYACLAHETEDENPRAFHRDENEKRKNRHDSASYGTASLFAPPTAGKGVLFASFCTSTDQPVTLSDHGIHQYSERPFDSNLVAHNN